MGPRSFKLGPRKVMYKESDVTAWLDQQYARARSRRVSPPGGDGRPGTASEPVSRAGRCQMTTAEQEAKTDEYVAKTLARAPQLTPDQRQRLTTIMKAGAK